MTPTNRRRSPARSRRARSKPTDAVRLIGYVRVSTDEQASEGVSLDAQRDRLKAYCTAHGYRLVRVEADAGVSGTIPPHRRPGFASALDAVKAGKAEGILALRIDRLSRRSLDAISLMDQSEREGWRLATVTESLDTGTPAGRMVVTILVSLAQYQVDDLREKTADAMRHLAREGKVRGRFVPFGFRIDGFPEALKVDDIPREERPADLYLVEHPGEQSILAFMLDQREAGKGPRRIANAMNEEGENPRTGRAWTFGNVQRILAAYDRVTVAIEEGAAV